MPALVPRLCARRPSCRRSPPLAAAPAAGAVGALASWLDQGGSVDSVDREQGSLLHAAARADQVECCRVRPCSRLKQAGGPPPSCRLLWLLRLPSAGLLSAADSLEGGGARSVAAAGQCRCRLAGRPLQLLIRSGAKVDAGTPERGTPLHDAAAAGAGNAATLLLSRWAGAAEARAHAGGCGWVGR